MKIAGLILLFLSAVVSTLLCLSVMREEDDIYHDISKDDSEV